MKTSYKKRPPLDLPFKYESSRDERIISLENDGVLCIPVFGLTEYHQPQEVAPEHTHPECLEICYCLRGELAFSWKGEIVPFRPGSVFVTKPEEPHRLMTLDKGLRMYWMFYRIPEKGFPFLKLPSDEAEWLKERLLNLPNRMFPATKRLHAAFLHIFPLYDTVPRNTPERKLLLRVAATELLLSLIEASSDAVVTPYGGRVETLLAEMRQNPGKNYSVDELAARAALSPSNLALRFKTLVGLPPHSFLVHCRIEKAKKLLVDPKAKVSEIAKSLGFPSAQHFATQFKNTTGKTPREWRSFHLWK